jgi:hypothetical protein
MQYFSTPLKAIKPPEIELPSADDFFCPHIQYPPMQPSESQSSHFNPAPFVPDIFIAPVAPTSIDSSLSVAFDTPIIPDTPDSGLEPPGKSLIDEQPVVEKSEESSEVSSTLLSKSLIREICVQIWCREN